jgi:preprotein translocase subunit SecA
VDYVVDEKEKTILLVDKNTGRIFTDRCWREGLHQAVQVKEELPITPEQQPVGHITRQRFFHLYPGKCGMTGTATGNERELQYFYRLPVTVVPTRKPNQRHECKTRYFADQSAKMAAIVDEIDRIHTTGQPLLVGTRTIEVSQALAERLRERQIPFQLLNGRQDEAEAAIVSRAGHVGTVTIATNMAGRGTDIKLGPNVDQLGGLHVIGSERHESARVDRQLVGRAARQGDPGSCQFFVAADDQLVALHAPAVAHRMRRAAGSGEASTDFSSEIARLQRKVEQLHFQQRRQMFAHDRWLDQVLSTLAEEQ